MGIEEKIDKKTDISKIAKLLSDLVRITVVEERPLYRAIAGDFGMDTSDVASYTKKDMRRGTARFLEYLKRLKDRIREKDIVRFKGQSIVFEWNDFERAYNNVLKAYGIREGRLNYFISKRFGIEEGKIGLRFRNGKLNDRKSKEMIRFLDVLSNKERNVYSSRRTYNIGELVYVFDIGLGEVVEKAERHKITIDFGCFKRVLIEGFWESDDSYRSNYRISID